MPRNEKAVAIEHRENISTESEAQNPKSHNIKQTGIKRQSQWPTAEKANYKCIVTSVHRSSNKVTLGQTKA